MLTVVILQWRLEKGRYIIGDLYFLLKKKSIIGTYNMYEIAFVIKNILLFSTEKYKVDYVFNFYFFDLPDIVPILPMRK